VSAPTLGDRFRAVLVAREHLVRALEVLEAQARADAHDDVADEVAKVRRTVALCGLDAVAETLAR
jgi:hypothetical protein